MYFYYITLPTSTKIFDSFGLIPIDSKMLSVSETVFDNFLL
ncbi:hypothetical protein SAMN05421739_11813 [Pontibacter chinhatensis]|uniref:Uncharacterized protein n=1 Tax=Pontibacter chinhatensis TaxID=1436961 RepID=A0A1I2ZSS6_9BACT|nr:hypothetical protein SAMN05421739_11813 [Pontibacter chinhatensis]